MGRHFLLHCRHLRPQLLGLQDKGAKGKQQ